MEAVIGLGSAGCNIADLFKKYPQYDVYKLDVGLSGENCFALDEKNNPEDYEKSVPDLSGFFQHIPDSTLFIVAGGGYVSGASLKILEQIKHSNLHVLYIKPDTSELTRTGILQEKLTFNVFQQYARSGLFKKLYIVSNTLVENIIGDVSILDRNSKINNFIVDTVHYINIFNNTDPVIDNYESPKEVARISTFGILDMESSSESDLYKLNFVSDRCYYFAINESSLKTDGKLLKKIRDHVSQNPFNTSFMVHATKHSKSFCYYLSSTNIIQTVDSEN